MIYFHRDGDWWDFNIGRFGIHKGVFSQIVKPRLSEAPGVWYFKWLEYQISWRRKWIVWRDHPYKSRNIRLYDQFGTFAEDNK